MNNNDLKYLLTHIDLDKKNIYNNKIKAGTNGTYIDYLKNNNINYKINEIDSKINNITIMTSDNKIIDIIANPLYPNNNEYGITIMKDKFKTEEHLKKYKMNTTDSKIYQYYDCEMAKKEFFKNNPNRKAVIKPLNGSLSKGVYVNVSKERFEHNWNFSLQERNNNLKAKAIVQEYLEGFEVRATILQGRLVSIIARIPAYVIGDGTSTIKRLVKLKNIERKKCNYLRKHLINITDKHTEFLYSQDMTLKYVPNVGEPVLLNSVSNVVNGGEVINITNLVSEEIKEYALNVLATFPDMYSGGLDIMIRSFNDPNPHVLEVNNFPVITLTKYPTYGVPCEPEKIMIESLIAQYQFTNKTSSPYEIENQELYIKDFINFSKRKVSMNNKRLN